MGVVTHAEITDNRNQKVLEKIFKLIHQTGKPAGFVTHHPFKILGWINRLNLDFEIVMVPLNMVGAFMDSKPEELVKILVEMDKFVVAKKVLAAGSLNPKLALKYVAGLGCVDAVAIGVSFEVEVEETFTHAKNFLVNL